MRQVKYCGSEKKANKWLKNNQDKEIIDFKFSFGAWGIVFEEKSL